VTSLARTTLIAGLLLIAASAALWVHNQNRELAEAPTPAHAAALAPAPESSTVSVNLDLDQQTITDALNALPTDCAISGTFTEGEDLVRGAVGKLLTGAATTLKDMTTGFKHKKKTNNPTHVSATIDYEGNLDRQPFGVIVDQGAVVVSAKLAARVRGYSGKVSDTVKDALSLQSTVKVDVTPDWQVSPGLDVAYNWTDKPVLNVLGTRWGIENISSKAINQAVDKTKASLPTLLNDSLQLKAKASTFWQNTTEPFALNVPGLDTGSTRELWLSITPHEVYVPTPSMKGGVLSLGFGIQADMALSYGEKPAAHAVEPLPGLTKSEPSTPGIHVRLPLFVSYEGLQSDWLPKLKGKDLAFKTQAGVVHVKIHNSKIYPSERGVAVGLQIAAQIPGKFLDTQGWLYLSGVPHVSAEGVLTIEDLHFSRIVNNEVVSFVSAIGAPLIEGELSKLLTYDLRPKLNTWQQYANDHLNAPLRTLLNPLPDAVPAYLADSTILGHVSALKVERVTATDQGLGVTVSLDGSVRAQVKVEEKDLKDALLKGLPRNAGGSGLCSIRTG
jgi:hypothetical protein